MILTAHQPNFFPYEGILEKVRAADLFVFLDHVQYTRSGYQSRFNIGSTWYTMSTRGGRDLLVHKRYTQHEYDWAKIKKRLSGLPLDQFDGYITSSLAVTNHGIFGHLLGVCRIKTELAFDYDTPLTGTARIVDLCKHFGAKVYLSGPSGRKYLEQAAFDREGIELRYFEPTFKRAAVELLK